MIARGTELLFIAVIATMMATVLLSYLVSIFFGVMLLLLLFIFRDPEIAITKQGLLSPIDGEILDADQDSQTIIIQADLLGKRVLRAPISGMLEEYPAIGTAPPGWNKVRWAVQKQEFTIFTIVSPKISARVSTLKRTRTARYPFVSSAVMRGDRICLLLQPRLIKIELSGSPARMVVNPGMLVLAGESVLARI